MPVYASATTDSQNPCSSVPCLLETGEGIKTGAGMPWIAKSEPLLSLSSGFDTASAPLVHSTAPISRDDSAAAPPQPAPSFVPCSCSYYPVSTTARRPAAESPRGRRARPAREGPLISGHLRVTAFRANSQESPGKVVKMEAVDGVYKEEKLHFMAEAVAKAHGDADGRAETEEAEENGGGKLVPSGDGAKDGVEVAQSYHEEEGGRQDAAEKQQDGDTPAAATVQLVVVVLSAVVVADKASCLLGVVLAGGWGCRGVLAGICPGEKLLPGVTRALCCVGVITVELDGVVAVESGGEVRHDWHPLEVELLVGLLYTADEVRRGFRVVADAGAGEVGGWECKRRRWRW